MSGNGGATVRTGGQARAWRGLPVGLTAVAGCWLAHQPVALYSRPLCIWVAACSAAALLLCRRLPSALACALALAAVFGGLASWTQWRAHDALAERIAADDESRNLTVVGYIDELPVRFEQGVRFGFRVQSCDGAATSCRPGQLYRLSAYAERPSGRGGAQTRHGGRAFDPRPGQRWRLEVRLKQVHGLANPGLFDAELRALEDGVAARGYVRTSARETRRNLGPLELVQAPMVAVHRIRFELRERMQRAMTSASDSARAVVIALVIGDQSGIRPAAWEMFNRTGIGHLISISGLHITLLAALAQRSCRALWSAQWLQRSTGLVLPALLPTPIAARLCAVAAGFSYSALAGWGIPAQRTCWMLAFALLASLGHRSASALNILSGAVVVVLLLDPWAVLAPGFWLSFAAVAAIVWFGAPTQSIAQTRRARGSALLEALRAQWAVSLALVPLGALFFNAVSLISPLANAVAIPVVSFAVTPLGLAGAAVLPVSATVGGGLLLAAAAVFDLLMVPLAALDGGTASVRTVAAPDATSLVLGVLGLALALSRVVPSRHWAMAALLPIVLRPDARPRMDGEFWVQALDVGQGMAVLVETRDARLLFDAGPLFGRDSDAGQRIVTPYLRWRGIDRLDLLVISHRDNDHAGGVPGVIGGLAVARAAGSIEAPDPILDALAARSIPYERCRRGQTWTWSGVEFAWLHPGEERSASRRSPTNANSCVLRIRSDAGSMLLTGDIEVAQERELIARLAPESLRSQVLLVPHHGSRTSSSPEFLEAVSPEAAVFQLGYRNRYRHPHPLVWARYQKASIRALRSDHDGAVELKFLPGRDFAVVRHRVDRPAYWRICPLASGCSPSP